MFSMITARKDSSNPTPFKKPYLCLLVKTCNLEENWFIDVDGQTFKYFDSHGEKRATGRLESLCRLLAAKGLLVIYYGSYAGEASATHILRDGFLFVRMSKFDIEDGEPVAFANPAYKASW